MNLTKEEIESNVEAYRALLDGRWREVDYWHSNKHWAPSTNELFTIGDSTKLRLRPKQKFRPWTDEEIPIGQPVRFTFYHHHGSLISEKLKDGKLRVGDAWYDTQSAVQMFERLENGQWVPCGVEDPE